MTVEIKYEVEKTNSHLLSIVFRLFSTSHLFYFIFLNKSMNWVALTVQAKIKQETWC